MKTPSIVIILYLFLFVITGCSQKQLVKTADTAPAVSVEEQISLLKEIIEKESAPEIKASAHLELAKLYYQNNDVQSNYAKALEELEKYATLEPEKSDCLEIRSQLAVLREVKKLKKNNSLLNEEIALLKETINKLNSLDIEMEMKREKVKQQTP